MSSRVVRLDTNIHGRRLGMIESVSAKLFVLDDPEGLHFVQAPFAGRRSQSVTEMRQNVRTGLGCELRNSFRKFGIEGHRHDLGMGDRNRSNTGTEAA